MFSGLMLEICLEDSQSTEQLLLETIELYNNLCWSGPEKIPIFLELSQWQDACSFLGCYHTDISQ